MNKQTKYTLLPKLSLESVYTDPINWIVVRGKDQLSRAGWKHMGLPGPPGWQFLLASPLRWTSLSPCWGDGLRLGTLGLAASLPGLAVNFALCGVRLALALCLSPGPVTD